MPARFVTRLGCLALAIVSAAIVPMSAADAAELVMFRRDGCSWCVKWDREIGTIYPKTEFNRRAPLRLVNLDRDPDPPIVRGPIRYTPTFVLAEAGKEVGRIEGYPGDQFFWPRLENLLGRLPQPVLETGPVSGASLVEPERVQ